MTEFESLSRCTMRFLDEPLVPPNFVVTIVQRPAVAVRMFPRHIQIHPLGHPRSGGCSKTDEEELATFRKARDEIASRVEGFVQEAQHVFA